MFADNLLSGQLIKASVGLSVENTDGSDTEHEPGEYFLVIKRENKKRNDHDIYSVSKYLLLSQATTKTSWWSAYSIGDHFKHYE